MASNGLMDTLRNEERCLRKEVWKLDRILKEALIENVEEPGKRSKCGDWRGK